MSKVVKRCQNVSSGALCPAKDDTKVNGVCLRVFACVKPCDRMFLCAPKGWEIKNKPRRVKCGSGLNTGQKKMQTLKTSLVKRFCCKTLDTTLKYTTLKYTTLKSVYIFRTCKNIWK